LWVATAAGIGVAVLVKFGLGAGGWAADWSSLQPLAQLAQINARVTDLVVGSLVPLLVLAAAEVFEHRTHPGWERLRVFTAAAREQVAVESSTLPALLCAWAVAAIAVLMGVLAVIDREDTVVLAVFSLILLAVAGVIFALYRMATGPAAPLSRTGGLS